MAGALDKPRGGRPRRTRYPLTEILTAAGEVEVQVAGNKQLARNQYLADRIWELLTTGRTKLLDGEELKVGPREWLDAVRWLYGHADPVQIRAKVTEDGGAEIEVDLVPADQLNS